MKNIQLFIPKFRNNEILEQISECLDKGWTGLGYKTIEIENEWKKYTNLPYAHFINSNTSGLHLSIKLLKDGQVIEYDAKPSKETLTQFLNTVL